jgi:uncharacterized 2Fe-2S/4Fe-4S cluster protein (DUF4445 family)
MNIETPNPAKGCSIAFDIGTTTLVGTLINNNASPKTRDGLGIKTISLPNPQRRWGKDVLSRIRSISKDPELLKASQSSVVAACNEIISRLKPSVPVTELTAVGNSVMEHLLLGINPEPLGAMPYKPAFKDARYVKAKELGLDVDDSAMLYAFPLIGGFVGGDTVAVALALELHNNTEGKNTLAIDIGTSSEIILSTPKGLYTASAAAGPAFEGGEITHGTSAGDGAIEGITLNNDNLELQIIGKGSGRAEGICGSGLISAVSLLLREGIIDHTGRIKSKSEVLTNLSSKIMEGDDGNSFLLFKGPPSKSAPSEITLSQSDIRALQVAKAAIRAGIDILINKAAITADEIDELYVTGAFGTNLNPKDLSTIGLLDTRWLPQVKTIGDGALKGAVLALDDKLKSEAEEIARETRYVSLSGTPGFQDSFIKSMDFPKI